jgi:hypothetical protein
LISIDILLDWQYRPLSEISEELEHLSREAQHNEKKLAGGGRHSMTALGFSARTTSLFFPRLDSHRIPIDLIKESLRAR